MSSQAETPSTDKSDTTTTESGAPRHAKDFDVAGGTGLIADPAADDSVRILPIVPPTGPNAAPSQSSTGTTERSTATPDTPVITGLDTMAGPETAAPHRTPTSDRPGGGTGGAGGAGGSGGGNTTADEAGGGNTSGDGSATGGWARGGDATASGDADATGGWARDGGGIAVVTGTAPAPAGGIGLDPEPQAGAGDVSVERLPTRLSLNKAKHAAAAQSGIFRLGDLVHSDARPTPEGSHMLGIVAWGTALALAGVGVGIRGLMAIIGGLAPAWYQPALIGAGLLGVLLTVAAFVSIQRRYAPWLMLAIATIPLAVSIALTIIAL